MNIIYKSWANLPFQAFRIILKIICPRKSGILIITLKLSQSNFNLSNKLLSNVIQDGQNKFIEDSTRQLQF